MSASLGLIISLLIPLAAAVAVGSPRAFLTREKGANHQIQHLLESRGVATDELPCIAFQKTAGYDALCAILADSAKAVDHYPWTVITSPAAAGFFAEAWAETRDECSAHMPTTRIASVGAGSAKVLEAAGLAVDFLPSKADGKTLAAELPALELANAESSSVLFPSSELAADVIADGLASRGIRTRRINTYTTAPAPWSAAELSRAQAARVVTFGSPSAARIWAERAGIAAAAVCIGEMTAAAARECGFQEVFVPSRPIGDRTTMIEAWAACCAQAVSENAPSPTTRRAPSPQLSAARANAFDSWWDARRAQNIAAADRLRAATAAATAVQATAAITYDTGSAAGRAARRAAQREAAQAEAARAEAAGEAATLAPEDDFWWTSAMLSTEASEYGWSPPAASSVGRVLTEFVQSEYAAVIFNVRKVDGMDRAQVRGMFESVRLRNGTLELTLKQSCANVEGMLERLALYVRARMPTVKAVHEVHKDGTNIL